MYLMMANGNEHFFHTVNPIFVLIGSLLPDCDHKHAPAGKFLPLWLVCKHRGFTHTIYGLVVFSGLVSLYHFTWGVSLAIGYVTHLMLDACTPMGIHLFGKRKTYRKG